MLSRQKFAVRGMSWSDKPRGGNSPPWREWRTALEFEDGDAPGLLLIAVWRGRFGPVIPKWGCSLLLFEHRIYGIDYEPDSPHTNRVGLGRPWHLRTLTPPNVHEHTWCGEGHGYAEPIAAPPDTFDSLFELFCRRAAVTVRGGLTSPEPMQPDIFG